MLIKSKQLHCCFHLSSVSSYQTWWLTSGDQTARCCIDRSLKASPTGVAAGIIGKTHNSSSWIRFSNIWCLCSVCSFLLQTRYFTKWASKLTGCVRLGGRVTPRKCRQVMSRMSPGLFLQKLNDVHFIKTFFRRTVRKVVQQQLCSGLPGSGDKIHIRLKRFNFTNVTTYQRTSSPRNQVGKNVFFFIH